jgi:hypothetical protein
MSGPRAPVHCEQIGPGLSVSVYEESVSLATEACGSVGPPKPVWVFASDGLESADKREVILGIVQVNHGSLPESPFWLVSDLHRQAGADVLRDGGRFEIQGGSIDFDPRVNSFLCLDYALDDPRLPRIGGRFRRSPLLMLALLPDELQAADAFGNSRVVALLAKESCCHPFPWWHDPRRRCVVLPGESPSVLARLAIPRVETPDVEVVKTGPRLDIIVPTETCSRLHALLTAAPDYFALLTGVAPQARARFYWEPGQTAPSATISAASMPPNRPRRSRRRRQLPHAGARRRRR